MDVVLKDSNGLPSASMTERLAESMDLTKSQVIKMTKFSPFGLLRCFLRLVSILRLFGGSFPQCVLVTKRLEKNSGILTLLDKPNTFKIILR